MNKRVTQFWFPAFLTLSLSMVLLAVLEIFGPKPWVTPMPGGPRLRMTPLAVVYIILADFLAVHRRPGSISLQSCRGPVPDRFLFDRFPCFPLRRLFRDWPSSGADPR